MDHIKYLYQYLLDSAETEVLVYLKNGQQIPTSIFGFFKMKERKSLSFIDGIFVTEMRTAFLKMTFLGIPLECLLIKKK